MAMWTKSVAIVVVCVVLLAVVGEAQVSGGGGAKGGAPAAATIYKVNGDCDAVAGAVTQYCRDFVVGEAPPSPALNSPCCKTLRQNRPRLDCLCGRINFAPLNKKNLLLTATICVVGRLPCLGN